MGNTLTHVNTFSAAVEALNCCNPKRHSSCTPTYRLPGATKTTRSSHALYAAFSSTAQGRRCTFLHLPERRSVSRSRPLPGRRCVPLPTLCEDGVASSVPVAGGAASLGFTSLPLRDVASSETQRSAPSPHRRRATLTHSVPARLQALNRTYAAPVDLYRGVTHTASSVNQVSPVVPCVSRTSCRDAKHKDFREAKRLNAAPNVYSQLPIKINERQILLYRGKCSRHGGSCRPGVNHGKTRFPEQ